MPRFVRLLCQCVEQLTADACASYTAGLELRESPTGAAGASHVSSVTVLVQRFYSVNNKRRHIHCT